MNRIPRSAFSVLHALLVVILTVATSSQMGMASDRLEIKAPHASESTKHIVLVAGDEEYRTEESMPMLAKILSQHHDFNCTVLFSFGPDDASYIDPNNQKGLRGLETLHDADLMLIGTRFRQPSSEQARHITAFLNAGKPVVGIRTATHAFNGTGAFGDISYGEFGRKVLGEQWVSHHGRHKREGARGVIEEANAGHPILSGVNDVFAPSDVYGVTHLTDADLILLRGAITETLDPKSPILKNDDRNSPMHPFAWLHEYTTPDGKGTGQSFCTTGGASVDLVNEDLRRLIVNAVIHLTGGDVPESANVDLVDPFYPSFYGFINDKTYWSDANRTPEDYGLGMSPSMPDPPGSPAWPFRPTIP